MIGTLLLVGLLLSPQQGIIPVRRAAAGATTHPGILGSVILYYDSETDADPHVNRGTKGSPTNCDLTKAGATTPTQNTTSPLQGLADYDFVQGSPDSNFDLDWAVPECNEALLEADFCMGMWFNRDVESTNDNLMSFKDSGNDGFNLMIRASGGCAGGTPYCIQTYIDSTANARTSGAVRIGESHHIVSSFDLTSGEATLYLNGINDTEDQGTHTTRNALATNGIQAWGLGNTGMDGRMDGFFLTDVECAAADACYIANCGIDNEEGCTYTGSTWTDTGKGFSCTMPATPSTYTGPS